MMTSREIADFAVNAVLEDLPPTGPVLVLVNGMGATIVMVTHDPELARRAHRNVQVIDGQITDYKPYEAHSASVTVLHPQAADATYG